MTRTNPLHRGLALLLLPVAAAAAPDSYTIDTVHSYPQFSVAHLGMSTIYGRFNAMEGKVTLDRAAKTGALEVKIKTASVDTGNDKMEPGSWAAKTHGPRSRDEHLRSADFFNVAEFPEMTYKSTKFNFNGDNLESIDGQLTLLGVSKPVKLNVASLRCGPHPFSKKEMCGAEASGQLKRSDFGMKTFVGPISDEVKLVITLEAYKD
jgi:polyisoprenoid-binding protein YceI